MDELDLGQTIRGFTPGQKILNRYTFGRILGRGGMGVVWLAHDDDMEREVALKFLPELIVHDRGVLDDLKRETRRSLVLTHHHIVRIYDFVQGPECACISMEYVDGATLSSLRVDQPDKVFEVTTLAPLIEEVCAALDYAHVQARIVHRDLKPSNVMVNAKGEVKVADFGIARSLTDSVSMLTMGRSGTSGTLVYMSPQQLDGEHVSELDDIYSLGATIYELLTGKPPFFSGQLDRLVREKVPPPMAARRADLGVTSQATIPSQWEETIAACLAKDPAARPQSAQQLKERLLSPPRPPMVTFPTPVTPPISVAAPPTPSVKVGWVRQHPRLFIGGIAGLAVAAAAISIVIKGVSSREEPTAVQPQITVAPRIVAYSPPPASPSPAMPSPVETVAVVPSTPPPSMPTATAATNHVEAMKFIRQFVVDHLEKQERCDCAGVLADYGSRVDYSDNGEVDQAFIARDCSTYVKAWPELTLTFTGIIDLIGGGNGQYTVRFGYDFDARNKAKGNTSRGHATDTWRLEGDAGNYKIVYHRETVTKQ